MKLGEKIRIYGIEPELYSATELKEEILYWNLLLEEVTEKLTSTRNLMLQLSTQKEELNKLTILAKNLEKEYKTITSEIAKINKAILKVVNMPSFHAKQSVAIAQIIYDKDGKPTEDSLITFPLCFYKKRKMKTAEVISICKQNEILNSFSKQYNNNN